MKLCRTSVSSHNVRGHGFGPNFGWNVDWNYGILSYATMKGKMVVGRKGERNYVYELSQRRSLESECLIFRGCMLRGGAMDPFWMNKRKGKYSWIPHLVSIFVCYRNSGTKFF